MKYRAWFAGVAVGVILGGAGSGAEEPKKAAPPLKLDKSAPLLLLDDAPAKADDPKIRKLICHDCHGNFLKDSFSITHAKHDVTCVDCHGLSKAHADDEANVTPPEKMYPREAIAKRCGECHTKHNAAGAAIIARWQERGLQKIEAKELVCTDCHGDHHMKVRTVHWDKKSGKLLEQTKKAETETEMK